MSRRDLMELGGQLAPWAGLYPIGMVGVKGRLAEGVDFARVDLAAAMTRAPDLGG